jgi:uncharacterized protein (TIGR03382 family)
MRLVTVSLVLCCVAIPATAVAQAFPPDADWVPLRCGRAPMSDRLQDQPGAIAERDIVGDAAVPAGLRASDATYLYLRMRLEDDPTPGGVLRPAAWGMQFDLDGDLSDYELMVLVDGITAGAGAVGVFRNTVTTLRNDPNDPADAPAAATYGFPANARAIAAPGSSFGTGPDFFLDFAVPWSALAPLGLDRDTPTAVWAGTSTSTLSLDGDLACHDGAGGPAILDGAASDPTTGDPALEPDGPGGTGRLEGGGGCAAAGSGSPAAATLLLGLLALRRRRR